MVRFSIIVSTPLASYTISPLQFIISFKYSLNLCLLCADHFSRHISYKHKYLPDLRPHRAQSIGDVGVGKIADSKKIFFIESKNNCIQIFNPLGLIDNWTKWPALCPLKLYLSSGVHLNNHIHLYADLLVCATFK